MKKILLCLLLVSAFAHAQTLVSYNLIRTYTTTQIDSILAANGIPGIILPSTYDVDVYKVVYNTADADTLPIVASGALFIPKNPQCRVPVMSYQHGTVSVKTDVPSTLQALEVIIGETSASDGAVVAMPDYIGLGDSPGLHPYVHAYTEPVPPPICWWLRNRFVMSLVSCVTVNSFFSGTARAGMPPWRLTS